nr:hypothetical protein CFP56_03653 [Quercus suber]
MYIQKFEGDSWMEVLQYRMPRCTVTYDVYPHLIRVLSCSKTSNGTCLETAAHATPDRLPTAQHHRILYSSVLHSDFLRSSYRVQIWVPYCLCLCWRYRVWELYVVDDSKLLVYQTDLCSYTASNVCSIMLRCCGKSTIKALLPSNQLSSDHSL